MGKILKFRTKKATAELVEDGFDYERTEDYYYLEKGEYILFLKSNLDDLMAGQAPMLDLFTLSELAKFTARMLDIYLKTHPKNSEV